MSVIASPEAPGFRIDMLWRDERYRGGFIQVVTMIIVVSVFAWLASNVIHNLAAIGKQFTFGFLWQPSNYEINQHLIDYSSTSTHGRAAIVGILNTLLVAVCGCVAALFIGIVMGVLRLSPNWLVSRIATVYVETLRNVPVLIWILLTLAILINILPTRDKFRGLPAGPFFATNTGFYLPNPQFGEGSLIFLVVCALAIGAMIAYRKYAARQQELTGDRPPVMLISLAILAVPIVLAYFVLGGPVTLQLPQPPCQRNVNCGPGLSPFNFQGGINVGEAFIALWLALSLYTGAFIAEIVRAGIQAVNRGQTEAAYALGLPPGRTMNLVILPQALRIIIPPLISQFLNLTKNSSLAIAVSYEDISGTLGKITMNQTGREMECILLLMLFYLCCSLTISGAMNIYNQRVKLVER